MDIIDDKESTHFNAFEWEMVKKISNENVTECAKTISQLILNFNGAVNFMNDVITERNDCKIKMQNLETRNKILEKCGNCSSLKKKLDDQNEKIQTLARVFGQITNTREQTERLPNNFDRVHDMFTEMIEDIPQFNQDKEILVVKRKLESFKENAITTTTNEVQKQRDQIVGYETPKKRIKMSKHSPLKSASKNDTEDFVTSPIIGRSKRNINSSLGDITKSPLTNLSNRLAEQLDVLKVSSPSPKRSKVSSDVIKESSPSLLGKTSDTDKTPSPGSLMSSKQEDEEDVEPEKRRSLSLLQKERPPRNENKAKVKRSPRSKKLKQARLSFTKPKPREPLDVSTSDNFCGGMRRFSMDNVSTKDDEDEMLKIALQLSLKDSNNHRLDDNDEDVIDASPANQHQSIHHKQRTHKAQVHRSEIPSAKKGIHAKGDSIVISDSEETMIFDSEEDRIRKKSPSKKKRERRVVPSSSKTITSPKKITRSNNSPSLVDEQVCPYVEPVVRNKTEKKNLQGWGCKKCKEFYEVAFEGNDKIIKEKMNECSRHRGKFNPLRTDTPAGFWDLKMPPTQDTEAFNKRNNRN